MLSNGIWSVAEISWSKTSHLCRNPSSPLHNHIRNGFHNRSRNSGTRLQPEPIPEFTAESGPLNLRTLMKPLIFTVGFSAVSIGGCAIWQYEALRAHAANFIRKPVSWFNGQQKKTHSQPGPIQKWWSSLRDSEKVFYPILGANVLVFGAWRIRPLQSTMIKYFCSNPAGSAVCLPMVLSTFSHYATLHVAANMYVLYSFMPAAVAALGKEQFVAMYLSAGVVSSFGSMLYKTIVNQPGLSLGASGAIMAVLSYVCVEYPDTQLSIIFLPFYTFAAGHAIKVIMAMDLAGVVIGWKFFDHAAHLAGALFGIAWCYWGGQHVWGNRDKLQQYWHSLRGGVGPVR